MLGHARERDTVGVQLRHGDLVVLGRVTFDHLRDLEQLLVAFQDLLEERGRHHRVRRHVVLAARDRSRRGRKALTAAPAGTCRSWTCR